MSERDKAQIIEDEISPFVETWDFYLQTETGAVKRITLPVALYHTVLFLSTHQSGRSPSYFDTEARRRLKAEPQLTYAEALSNAVFDLWEQPGIGETFYTDHFDVPERYERDKADFWALLDAREAAWRAEQNDARATLPPIFD